MGVVGRGGSAGRERAVGTTSCEGGVRRRRGGRGTTYGKRSGFVRIWEAFGTPVDAVRLGDFKEVEVDVRFGRLRDCEFGCHLLSEGISEWTLA